MPIEFTYDVFLSHSSKDKAVVRPLAERLRADGLKVWFDEWVLKLGDNIPAKIEDGLEHSRVLVLCMSAQAFGSDWAQLEAGTFRFRDPLNRERRFIPLRLDAAPIKGSLAQFLYINWRPTSRQQEYIKLLEACRHAPTQPIERHGERRKSNKQRVESQLVEPRYYLSPKTKRMRRAGKISIARYVVNNFLAEGDSIALDMGSSVVHVAIEIAARSREAPARCYFTILTHNLSAFQVLTREVSTEANLNVVLAGGRYDADLNGFLGQQTVAAYRDFFPRVVVMSMSGLVAHTGVFCHGNTEELAVKETLFRKPTRKRIFLVDNHNIGTGDFFRFGATPEFSKDAEQCVLVTDAPPKGAGIAVREQFLRQLDILRKTVRISVAVVT